MAWTLIVHFMCGARSRLVVGGLMVATLPGCIVAPDQRHDPGGVVMVAPPPAREEAVGVAPSAGEVWLGGYWGWVGDRYEWIPGHWSEARPGMRWVSFEWVRQGDGWKLRSGHWEREHR